MMKYNYIKTLFFSATVAGMGIFSACNDAEYSVLDTHAYIDEALNGASAKVTVQATGETTTTINIHMSNAASADSHYKLVVDPSILDEYNTMNGTSYITIPEGQYKLPEDILIKSGEYNAEETTITLEAFSDEMVDSGEAYALPVRLVSKDGNYPVMANTGTYIILAENIIEFSAPQFDGGAKLSSPKYATDPDTYSQYTIETRFQISNTGNRNRAIFTTSDGNNRFILLRFEDPQSSNNDHPAHSLVQIQLHDGMYVNPAHHFEPNKWQHMAVTFDGTTYRMYVNGVESAKLECATPCMTFKGIGWFTDGDGPSSGWWNGCKILVSQVRIWSVARNAAQIQNSMTQVSPKSTGLEAYWRMDEGKTEERSDGTYTVFEDATGKGHTLETKQKVTWVDGILSTDTATPW
ncbi:DUF1735 and LamG domain-containing protein [Phocaeicola sp. HCN-40430]|uniref:DUF1735 and LamG domain-containing protein n=1 Tax=Phocaeicola sp. HCN-40430 TaxID=3134664 RepID=UPI0030BF569D